MSEAIPGIDVSVPVARPRDAASVLLIRGELGDREVFWVKRSKGLRSFAGFRAFPGGSVDPSDRSVAVPGQSGLQASLMACAVRELFEETGLLLARGTHGLQVRDLDRADIADGKRNFWSWLTENRLEPDFERLTPVGRWITPEFLNTRFDLGMFLVEARSDERASVVEGELVSGEWIRPRDALQAWRSGESLLHPPNLHAMRVCQSATSRDELVERLRAPPGVEDFISRRIEFQEGIRLVPLRTPTLPPATHTNTYLVGNGQLLIVDPGASDPAELNRLAAFIRALEAEGARPLAIFLTHHHGDHVGGVAPLKDMLHVPVWAHAATASRLDGVDRVLGEGETIHLEGAPAMKLQVLHTPGHARGHLCLFDAASRALVCGDMVAGQSTIVIDPPEGNLSDYLESLRRLIAFQPGTLYQSHGSPIAGGVEKLQEYVAHRLARVEALCAALGSRPQTVAELVSTVYTDVPEAIHPIAERSAMASLEFLQAQGRARDVGSGRWSA